MALWSKPEVKLYEKFGHREFARRMSGVDRGDSRYDEFRNPTKPQEVKLKGVGKDELLLGCADEDFSVPVTIPYNGKSFGMLIVGQRGDGKTQLLKFIAFSQIYERFGYNVFVVDPKNDYSNIRDPLTRPDLTKRLRNWQITPKGYPASFYKPAYLNMQDREGKEFLFTFKSLKNLDYNLRASTLKEILHLDEKEPAWRQLTGILTDGVPETKKAFDAKLKKYITTSLKDRANLAKETGGRAPSAIISSSLDAKVRDLYTQGIFGDDGMRIVRETGEVKGKVVPTRWISAHEPDFIQDLYERKPVVLQTDLAMKNQWLASCYLKLAIAQIWENRRRYIDSEGKDGIPVRPTFVVLDEADVLIPRERGTKSPSRDQMNQLLSKGRQYGWGMLAITQQLGQISSELITHVDYIMTTRIQSPLLMKVVKDKYGLADHQIEELKRLRYGKTSEVKEWVIFTGDPDNPFKVFTPLPPTIDIKQEKVPDDFI